MVSVGNGEVVCEGIAIKNSDYCFTTAKGKSATITLTPEKGYRIASVKVDNIDVTSNVSDGQYTISDIKDDVSVEVVFGDANYLYATSTMVCRNGTSYVPIGLINDKSVTAIQFDMYMPDGITLKDAVLSNRKSDDHNISTNSIVDGVHITAFSTTSSAFVGGSGDVIGLQFNIEKDMEVGDIAVMLKNIVLTTIDNTKLNLKDFTLTLTVSEIYSGDADGDGAIDVNDVTSTINHILSKPTNSFIKEAADVDGDGVIDVNDVQGIIDIALGKRK